MSVRALLLGQRTNFSAHFSEWRAEKSRKNEREFEHLPVDVS